VVKIGKSILKRNIGGNRVKRILLSFVAVGYVLSIAAWTVGSNFTGRASAAPLATRALSISTSVPSATGVSYAFTFNVGTTSNIGSLNFQFCTTAASTCTAPTGMSVASSTITTATINAVGGFTAGTGGTGTFLRLTRTTASTTAGNAGIFTFGGIQNPSTSSFSPSGNNTFFARITTFSDNAYTTLVDDGVVASAIIPLLTVSARVQEILHFCVANTTIDDNSTNPGTDCASITGTTGSSVDIGVADNSTTGAVSPDTDGNNRNGLFMVRTNAAGGTVVGYRAVQQTGTNYVGALRISGATCTSVGTGKNDTTDAANRISTDTCFNSATAKTALTSSVEQFGMTGRFINRVSSATPTANLTLTTDYDSTAVTGYAWVQDGTFTNVATSVPSADKVIDDEAIVLRFAAVAALTTPTGVYTAQGDFVAVPTF